MGCGEQEGRECGEDGETNKWKGRREDRKDLGAEEKNREGRRRGRYKVEI